MRFGLALTAVLLLTVAVPHYAYAPLAALWPDPVRAARAWFYVLRGASGAVLFALVGVLVSMLARRWLWPALLVCTWGFVEEAETAVCRLGLGIGAAAPDARAGGLCSALTGLPTWWLGVMAMGLLVALVVWREKSDG